MDVVELAGFEHENLIETMALAGANVDGALILRTDGVAVIATGLPLLLFNQVLIEDGTATPAAVAAAVERFRGRGDRFVVNLRIGADDRFVPLLEELGFARLSVEPWLPGMALVPLPDVGPTPSLDAHEIRRIEDARGLEDHVRTAAAGFEIQESTIRAVMAAAVLKRPGVAMYVGYLGDEPVTTGLGVRTGRTIGVYNIATIASVRGRGFGAAMTNRVAADGAATGCDVAVLQASAMGYPIYERLGYRTVVEYMAYVEPPPGP